MLHMIIHSLTYITLSNFIKELESFELCPGAEMPNDNSNTFISKHVIPKSFSFVDFEAENCVRFSQLEYIGSLSCTLLINPCKSYPSCCKYSTSLGCEIRRKTSLNETPAKQNAPISTTNPKIIKLTLHQQRLKCKLYRSRRIPVCVREFKSQFPWIKFFRISMKIQWFLRTFTIKIQ